MGRITLSFDNGPHPEVTPFVIEVLARHGIKASFFVLGKNLESSQAAGLIQRQLAQGHLVGNHSYSHRVPLGQDPRPDAPELEIGATERLLARFTPLRLFRPFGAGGKVGPHLLSPGAVRYLTRHRYTCALWNSVPQDWIDEEHWVSRALEDCAAKPWAFVVLHDILPVASRHLEGFIRSALEAGHSFVQEFPPECVPIRAGEIVADLSGLTSSAAH